MREIENRIYVSDNILKNEYSYMYGEKKDELVSFTYYNVKRDKAKTCFQATYSECIAFARYRRGDKRYKNFEFLISD